MKKSLLTLALGAASLLAGAQVVEVQSITKVPLQADMQVNISRVSPDGSFAIVSNFEDNSLTRVDLRTGSVKQVADNGSALHLAFSPDASAIVFNSYEVREGGRRFYSLSSVDLNDGHKSVLAEPARRNARFNVSPAGILSVNAQGRFNARAMRGSKAGAATAVVGIYHGHLEVTMPDGTSSYIDPQGRGSYLWPSLSPDGQKILYYCEGKGCFVCDLDGSNVIKVGYFHAPYWLGNDKVVGTFNHDDGHVLTDGVIVAADFNGNIQNLTPATIIAINPSATPDGKTVTFTTEEGELYIMTLK